MEPTENRYADNTLFMMGSVVAEMNAFLLERLRDAGITDLAPSHGDILAELFCSEQATMGELAQRIRRDPSTVTALVGKLRKLGYVEVSRSDADKRVSIVRLSEKGRGFKATFESISKELALRQARALSSEERVQLRGILQKMHDEYRSEGNGR
ncbi:MAG: MarR family winged helix-turn-helix transcriptional regulator [Eggerthellaceae bacterium]